jgi:subtilisin family serine protease
LRILGGGIVVVVLVVCLALLGWMFASKSPLDRNSMVLPAADVQAEAPDPDPAVGAEAEVAPGEPGFTAGEQLARDAGGGDQSVDVPRGMPSDGLIAASRLVREVWSGTDAVGNRERSAIYRCDSFKYPMLRVIEQWPGKTGTPGSRIVMVADHLLVAPASGVSQEGLVRRAAEAGLELREMIDESRVLLSFHGEVDDPEELPRRIRDLEALEGWVEYAEPDFVVWPCVEPDDPDFLGHKLWGLRNLGGVSGYERGADIDAPGAWAIETDASSVVVAVTDTGIRYDHQDLVPNLWENLGETAGDGIDNDGNGVVDDVHGYDAIAHSGNPMDSQGHGTHVAGTIGARGNDGKGMTGVAWKVRLMGGKFLGPNGGTTSDGIKVINYSRRNGADIINASWGGGGFSRGLRDAIAACANEGVIFVAAAGNTGTNNDALPHYPSSYELPNVVAVAASNALDQLTNFSCRGLTSVDLAAPGWQIWSTYSGSPDDYRFLHGTSMATPHVSGALALARVRFPTAPPEELIGRLFRSIDPLDALTGLVATGGRLNLRRLLNDEGPLPDHDFFDTPLTLEGTHATWSGSNRKATREVDESSYSPAAGSRTLWYAWRAPHDGFAKLVASSLGAGQRVVVFSGETRATLRVVADSGSGAGATPESGCSFFAEGGKDYRIVTASGSESGELFHLSLELVAANDQLSRAVVLTGGGFEIAGSNRGASAEPFEVEAPHGGVGAGLSMWYRWTAPAGGQFTINTEGSEADTVLAIYTGDPADPASFTEVGANDDVTPTLRWSRVDFDAVEGETYQIVVDTVMGGQPGPFVIRGTPPRVPVIASQPTGAELPLGDRLVFTVGAAGTAPLRYQWFRDGEALPGAWTNTLVVDPLTHVSFGSYQVRVSNSYGAILSAEAWLIERRTAPQITWSTGDLAAVAGQDVALGVRAQGSGPMSYQWAKDGVVIEGQDQSSIRFLGVGEADRGVYVCRISNDLGTAAVTMVLAVVVSPFEAFTAARESVPNSAITDLAVIEGKCYAVTGERILSSEDGRAWVPWQLPGGFDAAALAKHGEVWFCAGFREDGKLAMITSDDGLTWNAAAEITGIPLLAGQERLPIRQLVSFGGRLVASTLPRLGFGGQWFGSGVYHSTNGVNWIPARHQVPSGALIDLSLRCRFELWGGRLFAPGDTDVSTILSTTDGITWQESPLPLGPGGSSYGMGKAIGTAGGRLSVVCTAGSYSTDNGIHWTMDGSFFDYDGDFSRRVVSTGGRVYSFSTSSPGPVYRVGSSTTSWTGFTANPPGQAFSAAVEFDGSIICGTTSGLLRRIESQDDFTGVADAVHPLERIEFVNGEFFAYRQLTTSGLARIPGPVLISGDGRRWRPGRSCSTLPEEQQSNRPVTMHLGGRYFGGDAAGWVPSAMSAAELPPGVAGGRAAASNGSFWLVVGSSAVVYSVSLDGASWTAHAASGLTVGTELSLLHFSGAWFLSTRDHTGARLYRSADGIAWSQVVGVPVATMALLNGRLHALNSTGSMLYETQNGLTWDSYPTEITAGSTRSSEVAGVRASRLLEFDGRLIALVGESLTERRFAFFSEDARVWFPGRVPVTLRDIAAGNGMLVGVTSNGAVLVTGSTGVGGAAPLLSVGQSVHQSTHVLGTMVEITGRAVDPEGEPVETECFVDGQSLGTTTAESFRFRFRATSATGHIVSLRGRDPAGLTGSDELMIFAAVPQLRNDIESEEGRTYLPQLGWVEHGGRVYAAGEYSLYRTRADGTWDSVLLPSMSEQIIHIVAGNGTLIVQTSRSTFITRDGVVWTRHGGLVARPILFVNGWFTATIENPGLGYSQTGISRDGVDWTVGFRSNASGNPNLSAPVITPGGSLLAAPAHRSVDKGLNWIPIPALGNADGRSLQFATAFGAVFAGFADGRVMRSDDDGRTWDTVAEFDPLPTGHEVRFSMQAGRLLWGGGGFWFAGSEDGGTWTPLAGEPLQSLPILRIDGRFVGFGRSGMVWSADGWSWQVAASGPRNPSRGLLAADGDMLVMGDTNGGVWRSSNGIDWKPSIAGKPAHPLAYGLVDADMSTQVKVGGVTVVGGTENNSPLGTFLWFTVDGGIEWRSCSFDGGPISDAIISGMWSDGTTAFAMTKRFLPGNQLISGLWRTTDGIDWQQVWTWNDGAVAGMAAHGGEWWCLGVNGALRRSSDRGQTWSDDLRPAALEAGRQLVRFDDAWIVIGNEAADFGGPNAFFVSEDGDSWTRRPGPVIRFGDEDPSDPGDGPGDDEEFAFDVNCAVGEGALVITTGYGTTHTATDRGLDWIRGPFFDFFDLYPDIQWIGGKFFLNHEFVSDDGIGWQAVEWTEDFRLLTPLVHFNGRFLNPPYWSDDGIQWLRSDDPAPESMVHPILVAGDDVLRLRMGAGAVWETADGIMWTQLSAGTPDLQNKGFARRMVSFKERLLAVGTEGLLMHSEDDGRSWQHGLVNGQRLPMWIQERVIKTSPDEVFAIFHTDTNQIVPKCRHFRSEDGRSWTEMPEMGDFDVMDYAWGDGVWRALCADGRILRSENGGRSWAQAGSIAGVVQGIRLAYFEGLWVAAGTGPDSVITIRLHTSDDGEQWTDRGVGGNHYSSIRENPPSFFTGHGRLHFGLGPQDVRWSSDGIQWVPLDKTGASQIPDATWDVTMIPMADGYVASQASWSSLVTPKVWKSPIIGGAWTPQPPMQFQVRWVGSPDGQRLFLFGPGIIKEWTTNDLAIEIADPAPLVIGVGDEVVVSTTLRNLGPAGIEGPLRVDAWLSADRFLGDGNDIEVGWSTWLGAAPAPGGEVTQEISFTLPNHIRPGNHYLITELKLPDSSRESNRANNVAITGAAVIQIPQRQLELRSFGDGSVSSDLSAEYHAHGARVALVATPGKGARFAGWGGDAVGSLSETLVVMDADKSVEAAFVAASALTVLVRGGGSVEQSSDDGIYLTGSTAHLRATPRPGWTFSGWSGALAGVAPDASVLMDASKVVTARFSLSFEGWRQLHFDTEQLTNAAISGDEADADGDGLENWREWLRGSDPTTPDDRGQGAMRRQGDWMVFTFTRIENLPAGHTVRPGATADLATWSLPLEERRIFSLDGVETIEVRLDVSGMPQAFLRIEDRRPGQ